MDLSREKPSKNVEVQSPRDAALAEYWWETKNKQRAKAGKGPMDPYVVQKSSPSDPIFKDKNLQEKIDQIMRRKSWAGVAK